MSLTILVERLLTILDRHANHPSITLSHRQCTTIAPFRPTGLCYRCLHG